MADDVSIRSAQAGAALCRLIGRSGLGFTDVSLRLEEIDPCFTADRLQALMAGDLPTIKEFQQLATVFGILPIQLRLCLGISSADLAAA